LSVKQSDQELLGHLEEQIRFLLRSADAYDNGFTGEAKRMATIIRILVHDTRQSTSLLTSLGKKDIQFYSTAAIIDNGKSMSTHRLVALKLSTNQDTSKATYYAPLDDRPLFVNVNKKMVFRSWWNEIIIIDKMRNEFSRKDLVLFVSNKVGGAHIDPELDDAFAALTRYNSSGWVASGSKGIGRNLEGVELVNIRQICHEVLKSLKDEFPGFFSPVVSQNKPTVDSE
jgi:hypothetical protein